MTSLTATRSKRGWPKKKSEEKYLHFERALAEIIRHDGPHPYSDLLRRYDADGTEVAERIAKKYAPKIWLDLGAAAPAPKGE